MPGFRWDVRGRWPGEEDGWGWGRRRVTGGVRGKGRRLGGGRGEGRGEGEGKEVREEEGVRGGGGYGGEK